MGISLNLVFWGANYYGSMAPAQRIKNLIDPLSLKPDIILYNLISNDKIVSIDKQNSKIPATNLTYSVKNPVSIIRFIILAHGYLRKVRKRNSKNIFYCYGSPCIENIFLLYFARRLGYKLVFDITEAVSLADLSKSPWHVKLYHSSSLHMQSFIPKWGSACFAISEFLVKYCKDICKEKIPVYFLPICVDIKKVEGFRNPLLQTKEKLTIFYGGSFGFKDGIPFLLEGFELAAKNNIQIKLTLTGRISRQLEDEFQKLINKSSVKDRINYMGCLPEQEYFSVMVNSDILCMVRTNSGFANAGFPFKLGEYLASGNVVLATKVGSVENYLIHKQSAFLINPDSPVEIAEAIAELAADNILRTSIGNGGKKVANTHFNNIINANKLYEILLSI